MFAYHLHLSWLYKYLIHKLVILIQIRIGLTQWVNKMGSTLLSSILQLYSTVYIAISL